MASTPAIVSDRVFFIDPVVRDGRLTPKIVAPHLLWLRYEVAEPHLLPHENPESSPLGLHRPPRRGRVRLPRAATGRTTLPGLAAHCRALHVRDRIPLLQQDHRREDLRPRSRACDA